MQIGVRSWVLRRGMLHGFVTASSARWPGAQQRTPQTGLSHHACTATARSHFASFSVFLSSPPPPGSFFLSPSLSLLRPPLSLFLYPAFSPCPSVYTSILFLSVSLRLSPSVSHVSPLIALQTKLWNLS